MTLTDAFKQLDEEVADATRPLMITAYLRNRAATLMVENHELRAKLNKLELEKVK